MIHTTAEPKALLLSKEETLALLDICMNNANDMQTAHEQALVKLGDLARSYMAEEVHAAPAPVAAAAPVVAEPVYQPLARVKFWTREAFRSRLHSLPPIPEAEACW